MLVSGVSGRLYSAISPLFMRVPGKLLHTNIAVSALFGAVSGASTSTAAAIGSVAYPELEKRGYDPSVVVGTLAAGGTLGLLIPPSLSLLIYGATQQVSIGQLFLAGLLPGLMLAVMMMTFIGLISSRQKGVVPDEGEIVPLAPGAADAPADLADRLPDIRRPRHDLHGPRHADRGGGPRRRGRRHSRLRLGRSHAEEAVEGLRRFRAGLRLDRRRDARRADPGAGDLDPRPAASGPVAGSSR